jgi:hypothetical protein
MRFRVVIASVALWTFVYFSVGAIPANAAGAACNTSWLSIGPDSACMEPANCALVDPGYTGNECESNEVCCKSRKLGGSSIGGGTVGEGCPKGPKGCCIQEKEKQFSNDYGYCTFEQETCGVERIFYSCCVCEQKKDGKIVRYKQDEAKYTYSTCAEKCKSLTPPGWPYTEYGAGSNRTISASEPTASQIQQIDALCFTPAECASKTYGGSSSAFRPSTEYRCPQGKGRCVAPEPKLELSYPIGGVDTVDGYRGFVATVFKFLMSAVATVAAVAFMYGGFRYIFGSAFQSVQAGKEIMVDSIIGLLLAVGAMTILQTINPSTLDLTKLDVFLIKKQMILSQVSCTEIHVGKSDKPLKFALAGKSPNLTPKDENTKYTLEAKETRCGQKYYVEDMDLGACEGRSCADKGEGFACLPCSGGIVMEDCGGGTIGNACGIDPFSGVIHWSNVVVDQETNHIVPLIICNWSQLNPDATFENLQPNVTEYDDIEPVYDYYNSAGVIESLINGAVVVGSSRYHLPIDNKLIQEGNRRCGGLGGFRGIALGVPYVFSEPSGLLGAAVESVKRHLTPADYLIATKANCGGSGEFSAYSDGTPASSETNYQFAYFCAYKLKENSPVRKGESYWNEEELKDAISGKKPIECDLTFTKDNAKLLPAQWYFGGMCTNAGTVEQPKPKKDFQMKL